MCSYKNNYSAFPRDFWHIIIKYSMTEDCIYMRDFLNRKIMTVFRIQINMSRATAIQFESENRLIRFNFTISFIFTIFDHRKRYTHSHNIIGNIASVNLLVYQMPDHMIASG